MLFRGPVVLYTQVIFFLAGLKFMKKKISGHEVVLYMSIYGVIIKMMTIVCIN